MKQRMTQTTVLSQELTLSQILELECIEWYEMQTKTNTNNTFDPEMQQYVYNHNRKLFKKWYKTLDPEIAFGVFNNLDTNLDKIDIGPRTYLKLEPTEIITEMTERKIIINCVQCNSFKQCYHFKTLSEIKEKIFDEALNYANTGSCTYDIGMKQKNKISFSNPNHIRNLNYIKFKLWTEDHTHTYCDG